MRLTGAISSRSVTQSRGRGRLAGARADYAARNKVPWLRAAAGPTRVATVLDAPRTALNTRTRLAHVLVGLPHRGVGAVVVVSLSG